MTSRLSIALSAAAGALAGWLGAAMLAGRHGPYRGTVQPTTGVSPNMSYRPPQTVQEAAKKGLRLRRLNREQRGLSRPGGTAVGLARARDLAGGRPVSERTIKRMRSYFARHDVDQAAKGWGSSTRPSPGYVAWLLWGGDPGRDWSERMHARMPKGRNPRERHPVYMLGERWGVVVRLGPREWRAEPERPSPADTPRVFSTKRAAEDYIVYGNGGAR